MGREGGGGGDGGRELNSALGPDESLGAKTGVSWCELQTAIGIQYDQKLEAAWAWVELRMGVCDMRGVPEPSSHQTTVGTCGRLPPQAGRAGEAGWPKGC